MDDRRPLRIEKGLELRVQTPHTKESLVHGCQHLHVVRRLEAELLWNALPHEELHRLKGILRLLPLDEEEVGGRPCRGEPWHLAVIDPVRVDHDETRLGLAEDVL